MIVKLYKKTLDQWSNISLYANCKQDIAPYLTRKQYRYTGIKNERDKERFEKVIGEDLSPKSEYWDNFRVIFKSSDDFLTYDTSDPYDEFIVNFLEGHKEVANGYGDRKAGARWVLVKEEEVAEEVNKKARIKIEALKEFEKLSPTQIRQALRLYGYKSDNMSMEIAQSTLWTLVEEDPKKFKEVWIDNLYRDIQFLIEEAVANNIIRKNKTIYKFGTDIIGNTIEEAIEYLRNPANADLRLSILSQIEGKKVSEQPVETREKVSQFKKLVEEIEEEKEEVIKESEEDEKYSQEKAKEIEVEDKPKRGRPVSKKEE